MKFGASFGPAPATASLEIAKAADESGFHQLWCFDSHVIWQDWCTLLGWLVAQVANPEMQYGTMVTNPVTRDPIVTASAFATLNEITGGNMICGIGRGDSVVRAIKRKPANLADVEHAVELIRRLASGDSFTVEETEIDLPWAKGFPRLPVYVAGYGPKALTLAGRIADGVIFQVADPYFIEWGLQWVRKGAEEAGREMSEITIHCATATFIEPKEQVYDKSRWFPAVVGNHIADVLRHHSSDAMPDELSKFVEGREGYDYRQHGVAGAEHSKYITDEIVDRFCVIGTEQECVDKIRHLESLGVSEFNLYATFMERGPDVIRQYGEIILPHFA